MQIKIDKLNEVRSKLQADNVKVSVNDFVTKAVAHALLECPDINCLYQNGQVGIQFFILSNFWKWHSYKQISLLIRHNSRKF